MNLSLLDNALWAASLVGHVALLCILLAKGRARQFPIFTSMIGFQVLETITLYFVYSHGSKLWYARLYWSAVLVDFLLQIGLVLELARSVLRPAGTWVRDVRKQFALYALVGVLVAAALAWFVSPPSPSALDAWEVRGNLFTSLLICELFVAMAMTSNRLGLGWRSHVIAVGQGLTAWVTVAMVVDALHSFLGSERYFAALEHLRMGTYLAVLGYWIVQLWLPEPARQPLSPEMRKYILALDEQFEYDRGKT